MKNEMKGIEIKVEALSIKSKLCHVSYCWFYRAIQKPASKISSVMICY